MKQIYTAKVDKVFVPLTNAKWLEARSEALGKLSAKIKVSKSGDDVKVSMTRRVKRALSGVVAKVLPSESELQFEETWMPGGEGGYTGRMTMVIVGQPVKMTADFSLLPSGKGCVYEIEHETRCAVLLIGSTIAKFAKGQVEDDCEEEFAYTVAALKKN